MGLLVSDTAAADSAPFSIDGTANISLVSDGLAGAEEVQVKVLLPNGTWHSLVLNGKLTVAAPELTLSARGTYMVSKPVTVGSASVSMLEVKL